MHWRSVRWGYLNGVLCSRSGHCWSISNYTQVESREAGRNVWRASGSRIKPPHISGSVARFGLWTPVCFHVQKAVDCLKPAGLKEKRFRCTSIFFWFYSNDKRANTTVLLFQLNKFKGPMVTSYSWIYNNYRIIKQPQRCNWQTNHYSINRHVTIKKEKKRMTS